MNWIRKAYLYVVSVITLVMMIFATTMLLNMGLKAAFKVEDYYYPAKLSCLEVQRGPAVEDSIAKLECDPEVMAAREEADKRNMANQRKRDIAQSVALLLVATPVFLYHWKLARKEV